MGRGYLKLFHAELMESPRWKELSPGEQGEALRMLLLQALEGKVPEKWKRLVEIREVGKAPKVRASGHSVSKYAPFREVWDKHWETGKGEPYVWDAKQGGGLRRAYTKAGGDLSAFEARVRMLWGHKNSWYQTVASPCIVDSHWNELAGGPRTARVQPPPMLAAEPKETCGYCGHHQPANGHCTGCRRPWKPMPR